MATDGEQLTEADDRADSVRAAPFVVPRRVTAALELLLDRLDLAAGLALNEATKCIAAPIVAIADDRVVWSWFIRCQTPTKAAWYDGTDWRAAHDAARATSIPETERDSLRYPRAATERQMFARDGWRCRYCGVRVIAGKATRERLTRRIGLRWGSTNEARHAAIAVIGSADHVNPWSSGGATVLDNLVTACACCQYGLGAFARTAIGVGDPRVRAPVLDDWDGLTRLR